MFVDVCLLIEVIQEGAVHASPDSDSYLYSLLTTMNYMSVSIAALLQVVIWGKKLEEAGIIHR